MYSIASNLNTDEEVLCTARKKTGSNKSRQNSRSRNSTPLPSTQMDDVNLDFTLLCILWKNGKLGASYYKLEDQQLYVLQEIIDLGPEFPVTRSLIRQVNPTHTVTIGNKCEVFVKFLINLATENGDNTSSASCSSRSNNVPSNLTLLHFKDFFLLAVVSNCESARLKTFRFSIIFKRYMPLNILSSASSDGDDTDSDDELEWPLKRSDNVLIDKNTFNSLHIIQERSQDSNFKHCRELSHTTTYSIFQLLSKHCKSKMGFLCLRNLLMNPTKNLAELNTRLDFIQFALVPSHQGFIESLQSNIKKIVDVNTIFKRIQYSRANSRDWEMLYNVGFLLSLFILFIILILQTIFNILFLHEHCAAYRASCSLFNSLNEAVSPMLYNLQLSINNALDFTQFDKQNRPVIRFGLDSELDSKQLKKQDIAKNVTAAAQIAVNQLPEYLNECSVVYVPEMGHYVSIIKWEPNCNQYALENHGFQFGFEMKEYLHYKNAMCYELDKQLGNIHLDILAHQNRIILRLSDFVMQHTKDIREPLKIIAMIDCLISMSRIAKEKGYVRPELNEESIQEIKGGRHPLLELLCNVFVPNDFYSGGNYSHMKILTGPNDSGKSVFLTQTALIIYLAHIGCYVPAEKANIGIVHSIHFSVPITESAAVGLSSFMLDLSQTAQSLQNAKSSSLVLIDEFGRGTTEDDGLTLLAGALTKFNNQEEFCPHILVSTHFQEICNYLPKNSIITYNKMDYEITETGELTYLYKVTEGISNSYAFDVASAAGLEASIISQAREIYKLLIQNSEVPHGSEHQINFSELNLYDVDIPEPDI
ncbi:hypothetical protein FQA39_LY00781 [Lamprigera yunnana]|nr:hypothetical protein FQA39_LY00781 [Lamprigera yunnana]